MRDHGDDDAEFADKVFQKAHDDSGWSPLKGRDEHPNDCRPHGQDLPGSRRVALGAGF